MYRAGMVLIVLAVIGFALFLAFVAWLNGGTTRHVETPPSWGDGGVGDDWHRNNP